MPTDDRAPLSVPSITGQRLKQQARAVATEVNFGADGASFNLSEKHRNLLKQAELYYQRSAEQLYRFPT